MSEHLTRRTGHVEWYTPAPIVEAARAVLGVIDLDPASCPVAQQTVRAARYYTAEQDGLSRDWWGRVWLNPPYARGVVDVWIAKLLGELNAHRTAAAILLVNNATETKWWQAAAEGAQAVCMLRGRVRFIDGRTGEPATAPLQGQTAFYYGERASAFWAVFGALGVVL